MTRKKNQTIIGFGCSSELREWLEQQAKADGRTLADFIRRTLDEMRQAQTQAQAT